MSIEFEVPKPIVNMQFMLRTVAEEMMRSKSRYFDEHEHEIPWDYMEFMHTAMKSFSDHSSGHFQGRTIIIIGPECFLRYAEEASRCPSCNA